MKVGQTDTKMGGSMRPILIPPHPDAFARSAVATIGVQSDTHGCLFHAVQVIDHVTVT